MPGTSARGTRPAASLGFTLLEVLVAMSLLVFGLALTFGVLRGATGSSERAEQVAQRDEHLRAVQGFLRRQFSGALPIAFEFNPDSSVATQFRASSRKVEFVANMPGYLSRGGPYLQTLELVRGEHGLRLQFKAQMLSAEGALASERPAEILLDGIDDAKFLFRGLDDNGKPGAWQSSWPQVDRLPPLLKLMIRLEDRRARWPELIVPLRMATAINGAATGEAANNVRPN